MGCGACCIAPSISSPLPLMPQGKPAGVRCLHLDKRFACSLFGDPRRPSVCSGFKPEPMICGRDRGHALTLIQRLELSCEP